MEYAFAERGAGLLLHITSLPALFGTGDLGPEAYKFADFMAECGQKYWQILPLSPTEHRSAYSPYSSFSSMAGNPLLISPEQLIFEDLLEEADLKGLQLPFESNADFVNAAKVKFPLFDKAYKRIKRQEGHYLMPEFDEFCWREGYWLHDYALFVVLRDFFKGQSWHEWPDEYKYRNELALKKFGDENREKLDRIKFRQFLVSRQWGHLKNYCNYKGIRILGDMPFYVSYDSADVWTHPEIFSLDASMNMAGEAGVPPDYFNEDGQLWRMPVFNWEALRNQNYNWWLQRVRKNTELFDLLRFDHFRAFSAYWEIPSGDETAKNGRWKTAPGREFFERVREQMGNQRFIAEDLGDIDASVYQLRDEFSLPGMKVLQFAFSEDLPRSVSIPHNYPKNAVAYTGTHDNNTTLGWYKENASKTEKKNLDRYIGFRVTAKNVNDTLIRMAYASVACIAIIPVQDILGLDGSARMNMPATESGNWTWRLKPGQLGQTELDRLKALVDTYRR